MLQFLSETSDFLGQLSRAISLEHFFLMPIKGSTWAGAHCLIKAFCVSEFEQDSKSGSKVQPRKLPHLALLPRSSHLGTQLLSTTLHLLGHFDLENLKQLKTTVLLYLLCVAGLGLAVGFSVGLTVGLLVGFWVGLAVGLLVGFWVGLAVGLLVGFWVGLAVGLLVGVWVGLTVGLEVRLAKRSK
jgi:hypothetical protein